METFSQIKQRELRRTGIKKQLAVCFLILDSIPSTSVTGGGLLQSLAVIERNVRMLTREYQLMYHHAGDFDERQFLTSNEIGTPARMPSQYLDYYEFDGRAGVYPTLRRYAYLTSSYSHPRYAGTSSCKRITLLDYFLLTCFLSREQHLEHLWPQHYKLSLG